MRDYGGCEEKSLVIPFSLSLKKKRNKAQKIEKSNGETKRLFLCVYESHVGKIAKQKQRGERS